MEQQEIKDIIIDIIGDVARINSKSEIEINETNLKSWINFIYERTNEGKPSEDKSKMRIAVMIKDKDGIYEEVFKDVKNEEEKNKFLKKINDKLIKENENRVVGEVIVYDEKD